MNRKNIRDFLDINDLQKIQNYFSNATGFATVVIDSSGEVTRPSNFSEFYIKYSDIKNEEYKDNQTLKNSNISFITNSVGMISFSIPIIVNDNYLGSFFAGQIFEKAFDEALAKKFSYETGVELESLISTLNKVPVISNEKIRAGSELLQFLINSLTKNRESSNEVSSSYNDVIQEAKHIKNSLSSFYETSQVLNSSQEELISEIENINGLLIEINSIVKSVSSLADETQMISFNASIEAARAGEQGKSFTVIAGEIRRLSEQSKKTVSNIQNFTANIQTSISKTTKHSKDCMESINAELLELNNIDSCINNILNVISSEDNIVEEIED